MWGLTINDKHTFDDFGLCCLSCTLDPPEPRLYTIDIPGADGVLDATAARGRVTYKNRTLTAEFDCHVPWAAKFQTRSMVAVCKSCSQWIIEFKTANGTDQAGAVAFKTCYI